MNVRELKKLASRWVNDQANDVEIVDAIMALPDDPQAEHEDLVSLAYKYHQVGGAYGSRLADAVIARFGKREPRKVEAWMVMCGPVKEIFGTKEKALERMAIYRDLLGKPDLWLARITGTEESE